MTFGSFSMDNIDKQPNQSSRCQPSLTALSLQAVLQAILQAILFSVLLGMSHTSVAKTQTQIQAQANTDIKVTDSASAANHDLSSRELLHDIITSDDYATAKESKSWKYNAPDKPEKKKEKSWLAKFIEEFFKSLNINIEEDKAQQWLQIFPMIFKGLLILALLALIAWIVKNASQLQGWINQVFPNNMRKVGVERYKDSPLSQSWENLPPHEQLADEVKRLVLANQLTEAASMLYRGSLRWLARYHQLYIVPATTEMQCLQQITQINQQGLPKTQQHYLSEVINLWIVAAYDPHSHHDKQNLSAQLTQLATHWLINLPTKLSNQNINKPPNSQNSQSSTLAMESNQ